MNGRAKYIQQNNIYLRRGLNMEPLLFYSDESMTEPSWQVVTGGCSTLHLVIINREWHTR